jgi:hypothetical protein
MNVKSISTQFRAIVALGATVIIGLIIAALTLVPLALPATSLSGSDKVYHCIAFTAFTFPCAFLYRRAIRWVAPFALIFGILIELIQPYVGRNGELADFYADALGATLGVALGLVTNFLIRRKVARH